MAALLVNGRRIGLFQYRPFTLTAVVQREPIMDTEWAERKGSAFCYIASSGPFGQGAESLRRRGQFMPNRGI